MNFQRTTNDQNEFIFYNQPTTTTTTTTTESVLVDVSGKGKPKMPLALKIYMGGLSVIGLYIVYRMLQKASRH